MRNMGNIVGNVDDLRREREARLNPPEFEAGQGDDEGWDFFDDTGGVSMDESAFGGSSFDSELSSLGGSVQQGSFSNGYGNGSITATEDKVFEGVLKAGKYAVNGSKELVNGVHNGLQGNDAFYWTVYGKKVMFMGVWISVGGLVLTILDFISSIDNGFWVLIGGLLNIAIGVLIFSLNCEKAKDINPMENSNSDISQDISFEEDEIELFDEEYEEDGWGDSWGDTWGDEYECDDNYETDIGDSDYDPWSNFEDSSSTYNEESNVNEGVKENIDIDQAINNITEIPAHTQTRSYLFEEFSKVLPVFNPEFARLKPISENSDEFIIFDKVLRDASIQVGTNEEKIPSLLELRENQFIIQIKATRPSGLKEDDIANEIANIYSRDEYGGIIHEGVYATTSSVGGSYIINIFKGENSIITLADTYREVKDYILNPKIKKPVVMGVNELGKVWYFDAENVFSYIISGKPRSGKSWSVVSLVSQLCMYSSPREVVFEVFDVKGTSSDYCKMQEYLPHFKRFESNGKRILDRLRYLVTTEADRRKKILEKNNVIAIADLKEKGVDVDIPYLYVLVDEIVGLIGTFSKDEHNEFKDLLNVLITQMPNLGIRLILVPHRVTNDIVPKTTYTNVGCIACVRSDIKEIINTLDITKKDFPYDLSNKGDMALKTGEVNKGKTVFCHGVAMTTSNESNVDLYRFIGTLWGKLEPVSDSVEETINSPRVEEYKGHILEGIDDSNDDESFWNDFLNS